METHQEYIPSYAISLERQYRAGEGLLAQPECEESQQQGQLARSSDGILDLMTQSDLTLLDDMVDSTCSGLQKQNNILAHYPSKGIQPT